MQYIEHPHRARQQFKINRKTMVKKVRVKDQNELNPRTLSVRMTES